MPQQDRGGAVSGCHADGKHDRMVGQDYHGTAMREHRHCCAVPEGDNAQLLADSTWHCPVCHDHWIANGVGGFRRAPVALAG